MVNSNIAIGSLPILQISQGIVELFEKIYNGKPKFHKEISPSAQLCTEEHSDIERNVLLTSVRGLRQGQIRPDRPPRGSHAGNGNTSAKYCIKDRVINFYCF